jgi:hypothetical protein
MSALRETAEPSLLLQEGSQGKRSEALVGRVTPCAPSSAWGVKRRAEDCARYRNARCPLAAITNRVNSPEFLSAKSAISVVAVKNFRFFRNLGSQISHMKIEGQPPMPLLDGG